MPLGRKAISNEQLWDFSVCKQTQTQSDEEIHQEFCLFMKYARLLPQQANKHKPFGDRFRPDALPDATRARTCNLTVTRPQH